MRYGKPLNQSQYDQMRADNVDMSNPNYEMKKHVQDAFYQVNQDIE